MSHGICHMVYVYQMFGLLAVYTHYIHSNKTIKSNLTLYSRDIIIQQDEYQIAHIIKQHKIEYKEKVIVELLWTILSNPIEFER